MRTANGREDCTGAGELIEAWAVLDETDEVGGPEENMDRFGVLNSEGWGVGFAGALLTGEARSRWSGAELGWALTGGRGEKMEVGVGGSARRGDGVVLAGFDVAGVGKVQLGVSCA